MIARLLYSMVYAMSSDCPGSAHMRLRGVLGSAFVEILFWGQAGKCSVRTVMVVEMLEAVEDGVEGFDGLGEIVGFVERQAPLQRSTAPLSLGDLGGRTKSWMALFSQASSNWAMNSDPPSTWMASTLKGMSRMSLSSKSAAEVAVARLKAWPTVHLAAGS